MRCTGIFLAVSTLIALSSGAKGDDSVASIAAGGIVLEKSEDIALLSEDLFISRGEVRVRFEFRNETARPIQTLVAFALPDIDIEAYHKHFDLIAPADDPANFIRFSVKIDGQSVDPTADTRALFKGRDVTEDLGKAGIPASFFHPDFKARLQSLPKHVVKDLSGRGLLLADMVFGMYMPYWTTRTRFYWDQTFPPGRVITIEHTYKPIIGINPNFHPRHLPQYERDRYCIDASTQRQLNEIWDRSVVRLGHGAVTAFEVDYVLSTGGNWRGGTIDRFRVTVETESPETIFASCHDGIKKTGPKTFVAEHRSYTPDRDLHFLFAE
jgi:hypothetical protein